MQVAASGRVVMLSTSCKTACFAFAGAGTGVPLGAAAAALPGVGGAGAEALVAGASLAGAIAFLRWGAVEGATGAFASAAGVPTL